MLASERFEESHEEKYEESHQENYEDSQDENYHESHERKASKTFARVNLSLGTEQQSASNHSCFLKNHTKQSMKENYEESHRKHPWWFHELISAL